MTSPLIYTDAVYGSHTITEPVLLDLLASQAMRRLQGVLQHGISGLIGLTQPITRFEHSVGAMLLVRRFGASLEEQIAALLHDVSHTAFSHVIDYVFDGHDQQSYHDEKKETYLITTDIPAILARHGFAWQAFLEESHFPLLEQPSPRLCADRLDYFLRDSLAIGFSQPAEVAEVVNQLVIANGRFATAHLATAQWLAYNFIKLDDASWANFKEVGLYELTAQAIRRALAIGAMTEADIWRTDEPVWQQLHASPDPTLQGLLALITPSTEFVWDETAVTFWVSTKIRAIDPDVLGADGVLRPLSTLDPAFAQHRQAYLTRKQGKWPMRVVPKAN